MNNCWNTLIDLSKFFAMIFARDKELEVTTDQSVFCSETTGFHGDCVFFRGKKREGGEFIIPEIWNLCILFLGLRF